jgi:hypothetical protein
MENKVISINVKQVRRLKEFIEHNGPVLISDAIAEFGQQVVGELLALNEGFLLVPDGGILVKD